MNLRILSAVVWISFIWQVFPPSLARAGWPDDMRDLTAAFIIQEGSGFWGSSGSLVMHNSHLASLFSLSPITAVGPGLSGSNEGKWRAGIFELVFNYDDPASTATKLLFTNIEFENDQFGYYTMQDMSGGGQWSGYVAFDLVLFNGVAAPVTIAGHTFLDTGSISQGSNPTVSRSVGQIRFLVDEESYTKTDLTGESQIETGAYTYRRQSSFEASIVFASASGAPPYQMDLEFRGPGFARYGGESEVGYMIKPPAEAVSADGNDSDPTFGGLPVGGLGDWFRSDWLALYNTEYSPWIYHAEHGWLYLHLNTIGNGYFCYDDAMGSWWWTNEGNYPSLYAFNPPADNTGTDIEATWLWYFEGSIGPRSFVVLDGASAGTYLFFGP